MSHLVIERIINLTPSYQIPMLDQINKQTAVSPRTKSYVLVHRAGIDRSKLQLKT